MRMPVRKMNNDQIDVYVKWSCNMNEIRYVIDYVIMILNLIWDNIKQVSAWLHGFILLLTAAERKHIILKKRGTIK